MSDHAKGCKMAGSYTVTTCPCCGNRITPPRPFRGKSLETVERGWRARPPSRLFDVDGNRADGGDE